MKIDIGFSFSEAFIAHMSREMSSLSNSPSMIRTPNFSKKISIYDPYVDLPICEPQENISRMYLIFMYFRLACIS